MPAAPWFVEAFTEDYLSVYPHRDRASAAREARAVLSLMRFDRERGRLLDLASGAGRHALAFRAERCHVTCLDLSEDLSRRSAEAGLATIRGDMRALPFLDWSFTAVTLLFSSFGYFRDDEDHVATLREVFRVLMPGGVLLLDLMDRDTVALHLVPQSVDVSDGLIIEVERGLSEDGRRVEKQVRLIRDGSRPHTWSESVRLLDAQELGVMADRAGLELSRTWGDFDGRPHVSGETRRLVLLSKPVQP